MRTIKFRGLRTDNKRWVYGLPYSSWYNDEIDQIVLPEYHEDVIPKSVGQFTGLKDRNGKEVYENDIFKSKYDSLGNLLVNPLLIYEDLRWVLRGDDGNFEYLDYYETETELEIIGNIHESRKLINN